MMKPFVGGPLILLVDDNPGRVEYWEHFFFRNGYLIKTATVDTLEKTGALEGVKLVLSYLPLEPEIVTTQGVPVILVIPADSPAQKITTSDDGLVYYIPASASSDTLFEMIAGSIGI